MYLDVKTAKGLAMSPHTLTLVAGKLDPGILLLVELEGEGREGLDKLSHLLPRLNGGEQNE